MICAPVQNQTNTGACEQKKASDDNTPKKNIMINPPMTVHNPNLRIKVSLQAEVSIWIVEVKNCYHETRQRRSRVKC